MGTSRDNPFNIELDPDTGYVSVNYNGRTHSINEDFRQDEWIHLGLVLDETTSQLRAYVNSVRKPVSASGDVIPQLSVPLGVFYVGGTHQLPDDSYIYFKGSLRQIQLFSEMKSIFEIEATMERTATCQPNDPSLILCYEFDAPTFKAQDRSANENRAVFFGGKYEDPIYASNISAITFASESNGLRLKFFPSSPTSIAHFRFLYEGATCPTMCENDGECVRGRCECAPGFTGDSCAETVHQCDSSLLVPGGTGSITIPHGSMALPRRNWFPRTNDFLGYPPLNCNGFVTTR